MSEPAALASLLAQLPQKWRKSADDTEAELLTIRREHPEGPRYGIAAVRACADELDTLLAARGPQLEDCDCGGTMAGSHEPKCPAFNASRALPQAAQEPSLRRDLAKLLDTLYGLHFRPGHLDALLEVINYHAPVKIPLPSPQPEPAPAAWQSVALNVIRAALESRKWSRVWCGGCGVTYYRCGSCSTGVHIGKETHHGDCGGHQRTACRIDCLVAAAFRELDRLPAAPAPAPPQAPE